MSKWDNRPWDASELESGEIFSCERNDGGCGDWGGQVCWNQESNGLAYTIQHAQRLLNKSTFFTRQEDMDSPISDEEVNRLGIRHNWYYRQLRDVPVLTPRLVMTTLLKSALEDIELQPGRCHREWDRAYPGDEWPTCRKCGTELNID